MGTDLQPLHTMTEATAVEIQAHTADSVVVDVEETLVGEVAREEADRTTNSISQVVVEMATKITWAHMIITSRMLPSLTEEPISSTTASAPAPPSTTVRATTTRRRVLKSRIIRTTITKSSVATHAVDQSSLGTLTPDTKLMPTDLTVTSIYCNIVLKFSTLSNGVLGFWG